MALIGNRSVLLKSPGRFLSGTIASIERSNFSTRGMQSSRFQAMNRLSGGIPAGHLSPASWSLPRTAGGMSSRNECEVNVSAGGSGALGLGVTGAASLTLDAVAVGQLIAGAVGLATLTVSSTGAVTATIGTTGLAAVSVNASGTLGARAWLGGAAAMTVTGAMQSYAIGHMAGTTEDLGVLTPAAVATAVWAKAIEAGYTAEQLLRIITSHAAGDATGLDGNPAFKSMDGSKTRVAGTITGGTRTVTARDGA